MSGFEPGRKPKVKFTFLQPSPFDAALAIDPTLDGKLLQDRATLHLIKQPALQQLDQGPDPESIHSCVPCGELIRFAPFFDHEVFSQEIDGMPAGDSQP